MRSAPRSALSLGRAVPRVRAWSAEVKPQLERVLACHDSQFPDVIGPLEDILRNADEHGARLGHEGEHAERYWQLAGALDDHDLA